MSARAKSRLILRERMRSQDPPERSDGADEHADELSVLMGVSGCGKSTVAGVLAGRLGWDFGEGDDLHPPGERRQDGGRAPAHRRRPLAVAGRGSPQWIREHTDAGRPGIITCSALKRSYRDVLRGDHVVFVYLHGTREQIATAPRRAARPLHAGRAARLAIRDARTAGRGRARAASSTLVRRQMFWRTRSWKG